MVLYYCKTCGRWQDVSLGQVISYEVHELEMENKMSEKQPTEEEALGKLAYDAYCQAKYGRPAEVLTWQQMPQMWRNDWTAVAKAVAERVIVEMQTGVEASE